MLQFFPSSKTLRILQSTMRCVLQVFATNILDGPGCFVCYQAACNYIIYVLVMLSNSLKLHIDKSSTMFTLRIPRLHNSSSNWHEQKSLMWLAIHFAPCLTIILYLSLTVVILIALTELQQLHNLAW